MIIVWLMRLVLQNWNGVYPPWFIHVYLPQYVLSLIARFMGPIWGRQDPGGPHVGPMIFAIWDVPYVFMDTTAIDKTNFKWTLFLLDVYLLIHFETSLCTKHILMHYNNYIVIWFKEWPKTFPSWHIRNRTGFRAICISHELADVLGTGFWSAEPYFKEVCTMRITCQIGRSTTIEC